MKPRSLVAFTLVSSLIAVTALAGPGSWKQIGKAGDWKGTTAGAMLGDKLYTTEIDGHLYVTDPRTGTWKSIGKPEFGNTVFLCAAGPKLYSIEIGGSLYAIDPATGSWARVGKPGEWIGSIAGAMLGDKLYTVERNGALYVTELPSGNWKQIGKPEFGDTVLMFAAGSSIYTIEKSGTLYRVDPASGAWSGVGKPGEWRDTIGGAMIGDKLYTAEVNGALYVTDPASGAWKQLGKFEFGGTRLMYAFGGGLLTIEADGTLYAVDVK